MTESVFGGLRVLDLTEGFAGALAGMLLADNGAAVVRAVPPSGVHEDPADAAAGVRQWHRSKDVRQFDPRVTTDADELARLWRESEVVIGTGGAWVLEQLPGGAAALLGDDDQSDADGRIRCFIDAGGEHATLATMPLHSGVAHAASGRMLDYGRTFRRDRPVYVAPPLAEFGAATAAVHGICAALHDRHRTARGQLVRTSLLRGLTAFDLFGPMGSSMQAQPAVAGASAPAPRPALGYIPARTKDGPWLQWANFAGHLLWHELELLGLGALRDDPAYARLPDVAPDAGIALWERVLEATAERTAAEWQALLTERGTAGGDLITHTREGMDHPQARHNGDVIAVDDPVVGASEQIGPIARFSATPSRIGVTAWGSRPAPATMSAPVPGDTGEPTTRPPLDGLLIVEAATMIATPWSTSVLADLGARVVKVEPLGGEAGRSLPFLKLLQGKQSVTVDVKSPEGREVVHRLVAKADSFVHNYRPGVPEKLGIDAATLRAINPRLVYVYAGAYGSDGPYARMPGYHPSAGAIAGNAALQAGDVRFDTSTLEGLKAESLHRFWSNEGHPDAVTGMLVAAAILMGIVARDRLDLGQDITASMVCANAYLMSDDWIRYPGAPTRPTVDGELLGTGPLARLYRARDAWVYVAAPTQAEWRRLCALLDAPALADDPRFVTADARAKHADDLAATLEQRVAERGADDLEAAAAAAGVACVRADRAGAVETQQAEIAAGRTALVCRVESPQAGAHWRAAALVEMAGVGRLEGASLAGQQTRAILDELGYDDTAIDELVDRGIVGAPTPTA